jgi:hypothetical protein
LRTAEVYDHAANYFKTFFQEGVKRRETKDKGREGVENPFAAKLS